MDQERFGGLTAYDTRRDVYGAERRAILTHSPELHDSQARGFNGTTLAKAGKKLDELAATLARGKTRRAPGEGRGRDRDDHPQALGPPGHHLAADRRPAQGPAPDLAASTPAARAALEEEIFGKHVLITDHDDWPVAEVVAGYRSQSEAEFSFRQLKDTARRSPSPRCTTGPSTTSASTSSPASWPCRSPTSCAAGPPRRAGPVRPRTARPARRHRRDRPDLPATGGRPKARRMPTETSPLQDQAHRHLRPRPLRPQAMTWVIHPTGHRA